MGMPSTSNYSLGRGIVYFDRWDADDLPTGLTDIGNCLSFSIQTSVEMLKHYSNRTALRSVDREEPVSAEATGKLTLDEYSRENLAMGLFGTVDALTVQIMNTTRVRGQLRFIGAASNNPRYKVELWRVSMRPANPTTFVTDANEWGKLDFEFTIENDSTNHASTPYGFIENVYDS